MPANANAAKSLERAPGLANTKAAVLGQELSMGKAASGEWSQRMAKQGLEDSNGPEYAH